MGEIMQLYKPKVKKIINLLLLVIMLFESGLTQYLSDELSKAFAASMGTLTTPVTFLQGGATLSTSGKYYARSNYLSGGTVNITSVPAGNVIKRILHNGQDVTPPAAIGVKAYSGSINDTHNGVQRVVTSVGNASGTKGYYAWYRYIPGGSQGSNWYADVPDKNGNMVKISCGPDDFGPAVYHHSSSADTERIKGHDMPTLPGCSTADFSDLQVISLHGQRDPDKKFKLDAGGDVEDSVVTGVTATSAQVNPDQSAEIPGPDSHHKGYPRPDIISVAGVTPNADASGQYRVTFQQKFIDVVEPDFESSYELGSPPNGAKVITYYAAFIVDLKGYTYEYDGNVTVEYEPPPNGYNISNVSLTGPACVEVNHAANFTFSFTNTGATNITTPFAAKVMIDGATYQTFNYDQLNSGQSKTETFSKSFGGTSIYGVTIVVDTISGETNPNDNSKGISVSPVASCSTTPSSGPELITGTLSVRIPSIEFGTQTEYIDMSNVSVSGGNNCQLATGTMIYTQGSVKWPHNLSQSGDFEDGFQPTTYNGIGAGNVSVQYDITTTCGTKKTIGPGNFNITINSGIAPPVFQAAWFDSPFYSGYNTPITMIPIGETISFGLIRKPATALDPGTPYDPNGAAVMYTTDINTNPDPWINRLFAVRGYGIHDDHFSNVLADAKGLHTVSMSAIDDRGAVAPSQQVTISIVDPNPVPLIYLPPKVIEGRPFTPDISCASSYSPYRVRTIASCDWHGTKRSVYPTFGDYPILLDVTDNTGMKSLSPALDTLHVLEDLPPNIQANLPSVGIRGSAMNVLDTTFSPDGDTIVQHTDTITCDRNQNGDFTDDPVVTVLLDATGKFSYMPSVVGNCKLHVFAQEDWGKNNSKDFDFIVVNQQPVVEAAITGEQPNPSSISAIKYNMKDLLDISKFKVDDFTNVSRYSGLYYDPNEDALAAPDRSNMLYLAPQNSNVIADNNYLRTSYYYYHNSFHPAFGIENRVNEHVWYNQAIDWGCENGSCYPSNPVDLYIYNDQTNLVTDVTAPRAPGSFYGGTGQFHVNPEKDQVAFMAYPSCDEKYAYNASNPAPWDQYNYKFSELMTSSTTALSMTSGTYYMSDCKSTSPPPTNPFSDRDAALSSTSAIPFNYEVRSSTGVITKSTEPLVQMNQSTDRLGNLFVIYNAITFSQPDRDGDTYQIYNTQLEKFDSSGHFIWRSPRILSNPYNDWFNKEIIYPKVQYVSLDNSKILTSDGIYDNNTGAFLGALPNSSKYTDFSKVFDDILYYQTTTGSYLLYNLKTGAATDTTYAGDISADGKIVAYNQTTKMIDVADIYTGRLLYSVPLNAPNGFQTYMSTGSDASDYAMDIFMTGDGKYKVRHADHRPSDSSSYDVFGAKTTPPISAPAVSFSYGNLTDRNQTYLDGSLYLSMRYVRDSYNDYGGAGITFRAQDHQNMYRAELTTSSVVLSKIVNGSKTIISKQSNPLALGEYAALKVQTKGDRIKVYVNGVPFINVQDATFRSGAQGIFAEAPNIYMKGFRSESYEASNTDVENTVIVGTEITYTSKFTDPENDPSIPDLKLWTYTNTAPEKFLDAGDGYSDTHATNAYVNHKTTGTIPILYKVGLYKVDYEETDDPAPAAYRYPNPMYKDFRMAADPATNMVIVHRQPFAPFTAAQGADYTITYDDHSYDPDRWLSPSNYSAEKAEYATNRGVYQHRYSYTTPSGDLFSGKLVRPNEKGTYTLRQAVADEYGAWSDWYEVDLHVDVLPPNNPPSIVLTFPNGTQNNPSYVDSLTPIVKWNQDDPDIGTTFTQARVLVKDELGNTIIDRTFQQNTTSTDGLWQLDTRLSLGSKYQVQAMTQDDGGSWSPWSTIGWMISNRPPEAEMTVPDGTQSAPTIFNTLRPTLHWKQTDPDPGTVFTYFQIQITNEANDTMILDSGQYDQGSSSTVGSWLVNTDLPAGQKLRVRVRVYDGYVWSSYSEQTWMVRVVPEQSA
ncbi:hypothetical protein [Paenibacillus sp. SI8]|uniref:hypothetical protein n=1 Tax=unclassified Paenibacillus TaxID=185978 RepID=UPI003466D697